MVYLFVLREYEQPTPDILERTLGQYQKLRGWRNVRILGGTRVTGRRLPRGPDVYVVALCFNVCEKNGLPVDAKNDISYSIDVVDGEEIGVCQIGID
jgi:hypothetical protein